MNFKVENIVRGTGLVYFNVSVDEDARRQKLTFKAKTDEGVEIPCIAHDAKRFEVLADFILVIPLLCFKSITIYCDDCKDAQTFSSSQIKWVSRWNYKINKQTAAAMRDFEKRPWANNVRFHFKMVMDDNKHEKLIKAFVNYPSHSEKPVLKILDSHGKVISDSNIFIGDVGEIEQEGFKRKEYPFTLRAPEGAEFCLYAESQDLSRSAIVFMNNAVLESCKSQYTSLWNVCNSWEAYQQRVYAREFLFKTEAEAEFSNQAGPKFSIVCVIHNTTVSYVREMIESVQKQYYKNWELILVGSFSDDAEVLNSINQVDNKRIKIVEDEQLRGISACTNAGIRVATGDFVGFVDCNDTLDPRCLSLMAERINDTQGVDVLYADHDIINSGASYFSPAFKPSLNIDYLRAYNYISHCFFVKSSLAKGNKFNSNYDGAQDYDYLLRLTEQTNKFEHIDEVLWHLRAKENQISLNAIGENDHNSAAISAIQNHLDRLSINANVTSTPHEMLFNPIYSVVGKPKVSIIIPNKNCPDVLKTCVDSIFEKTEYSNFEVVIVENGSDDPALFGYYDEVIKAHDNVKVIKWQESFNFSKVCNFGAKNSEGEFLLFLNNDTELIDSQWLELMLGDCQRDDVGVVGAKLIYPDDTIQHAGVFYTEMFDPAFVNGPGHLYFDLDKDDFGYSYRAYVKSNVQAVTGACLMTKAEIFKEIGMFDEEYVIDYSDIDYCFKATAAGYKILMDPSVVLRHYESLSLGVRSKKPAPRFIVEQDRLRTKWASKFINGDELSSYILKLN